MDVDRPGSGIVKYHVLLQLANTKDGRLKNLLDEYTFLWMDHLVVTFFKLPVNVNILDVQTS